MSLKNASVVLTYKVRGTQLTPGKYEYKERTTSGSVLPEKQRLFTVKKPVNSDCYIRVVLTEQFVNNAISMSGAPFRKDGRKAEHYWKKLSEEDRLFYHVSKYVKSRNAEEFNYDIVIE